MMKRLSKFLSEEGICSRREADELISKGWILVNGEAISELGFKVSQDDRVDLSKEAKNFLNKKVTVLLNKPVGYVSNMAEKGYIPAIRLIQAKNQFKFDKTPFQRAHLEGLAVAGRLDIDSKGLLVMTQDGSLAKKIIGEDSDIEKEYLVWVDRDVSQEALQRLNEPMILDEKKLKPARVELLSRQKLRFVLKQGKKRQIRRMCEQVQLNVTSLKRTRIGNVKLADLPEGQWRYLTAFESF